MNDELLASRLRAVAGCDTDQFVELAKLSGLKPSRDFRYADLSYADLRHQDMSAFDLSHADLTGAQILGAKFNDTVSRRQRAVAVGGVRAVTILIGRHLLADHDRFVRFLGEEVFTPTTISQALEQLAHDPERRIRRTGIYLGDRSDLVRRRLSKPFKHLSPTLRATGACFILFEPTTDLDFDVLKAVQNYLKREQTPAITLVLHAQGDDSLGQLFTTRMRASAPETWLDPSGPAPARPVGLYKKPVQSLTNLERHREKTAGFMWACASARSIVDEPLRTNSRRPVGPPIILDGARRGPESLHQAMARDIEYARDEAYGYAAPDRLHILVREDLCPPDVASRILSEFGGRRTSCRVSVFPRREGYLAEYYIVSGLAHHEIWAAIASAQAPSNDSKRS